MISSSNRSFLKRSWECDELNLRSELAQLQTALSILRGAPVLQSTSQDALNVQGSKENYVSLAESYLLSEIDRDSLYLPSEFPLNETSEMPLENFPDSNGVEPSSLKSPSHSAGVVCSLSLSLPFSLPFSPSLWLPPPSSSFV